MDFSVASGAGDVCAADQTGHVPNIPVLSSSGRLQTYRMPARPRKNFSSARKISSIGAYSAVEVLSHEGVKLVLCQVFSNAIRLG